MNAKKLLSLLCALGVLAVPITPSRIALAEVPPAAAAAGSNDDSDVVVDAATESVIKGGLRFLAAKQSATGYWCSRTNNHHAAITAYVLIAYMSCGNLPGEGEFSKPVQKGMEFLLSCCR